MTVLSTFTSLYMLAIFIRILLTWFSGSGLNAPGEFLGRFTDPYLNWFRRFRLRAGMLDLSPLLALALLSLANQIFATLARYGVITIGFILALLLRSLWSALSFILGFCIIILILRLIAFFAQANIYSPFWRVIDTISASLLFRINRILFGARIVNFRDSLFISIIALVLVFIAALFLINLAAAGLVRLPF
jgi:YggT family protein